MQHTQRNTTNTHSSQLAHAPIIVTLPLTVLVMPTRGPPIGIIPIHPPAEALKIGRDLQTVRAGDPRDRLSPRLVRGVAPKHSRDDLLELGG